MDSVKTDVKHQIIFNYLFDSFDEASDVNNRENLELDVYKRQINGNVIKFSESFIKGLF